MGCDVWLTGPSGTPPPAAVADAPTTMLSATAIAAPAATTPAMNLRDIGSPDSWSLPAQESYGRRPQIGFVDDYGVGMTVSRSASPFRETLAALLAAIEQRGLTVFALIDHAEGARQAGLELADETVVVFGNPRAGTPLMQDDPRIGIELPLRILVWRSGDDVLVGHADPREWSELYDVGERAEILETMAALLEQLTTEATA